VLIFWSDWGAFLWLCTHYAHYICIVERHKYVLKRMYVYALALESAETTVLMFWLLACILPNVCCTINNVLFPSVFLTVPLLLQNFCQCSQKTSTLLHFLHCTPVSDIFVDMSTQRGYNWCLKVIIRLWRHIVSDYNWLRFDIFLY